ncbi:MAG: BrnA antitoxin family protein [Candidatus Shapirobacteria bacterium]
MNKDKKVRLVPKFKNEAQERKFWANHDLADYLEQFQSVNLDLSELRPSTKPITIRLPVSLISALKGLAHKRDVPYQSLLKIFLAERVEKEIKNIHA